MARSCGIRIGSSRFELVVLDGSPKKPKITAYMAGELPHGGDDATANAAHVLREAMKQHNVPRDNVGLVIDSGAAAFRTLRVPFSDKAKIEDVIKFEVESMLPQWSIDDVIVDFHVLESTDDSSELLVTAVPKSELKKVLNLCEKAGIEPLEVELETTAMVNAAYQADICTAENAVVLVHIGEESTAVVVVDGGKVREMRSIRIGALSHEIPILPAEGEAGEGGENAAPLEPNTASDPSEIARRLDQANKRIRRELGRTVSAARTVHPIEAVYVCGFELPGLIGSSIIDSPVKVLDALEKDGGGPVEGFGPLVVPFGAALRQLGGGILRPSLRREEMRYTGAFEKVELPLAVVALLLLAFTFVWLIFVKKERNAIEDHLVFWRESTKNFLVGELAVGRKGSLEFPSDAVAKYVADISKDDTRTTYEQMERVKRMLEDEVKKLEKDLGQDTEITQPQSALQGFAVVLGVLEQMMGEGVRPSLRKVQATYVIGRPPKPDHVRIVLDLSFFAENSAAASGHNERFRDRLKQVPGFLSCDEKPTSTLEGDKGITIQGLVIELDVSKARNAAKGA